MSASSNNPSDTPLFTSDPNVMNGRLVFRGTRIPIEVLFDNLADGMSLNEILDAHPTLKREDAVAAIRMACEQVKTRTLDAVVALESQDARRQTIARSSERLGRVFARFKRVTSESR